MQVYLTSAGVVTWWILYLVCGVGLSKRHSLNIQERVWTIELSMAPAAMAILIAGSAQAAENASVTAMTATALSGLTFLPVILYILLIKDRLTQTILALHHLSSYLLLLSGVPLALGIWGRDQGVGSIVAAVGMVSILWSSGAIEKRSLGLFGAGISLLVIAAGLVFGSIALHIAGSFLMLLSVILMSR